MNTSDDTTDKTPSVFAAIAAVSAQLAKHGIAKNSENKQQGFFFRGIDDVLNALAGALPDNGLVILPEVLSREVTERSTRSGGILYAVTLQVKYTFTATADASSTNVVVYGEAMDSGDKATNKALSAAYKYMAIQSFAIPIIGEDDADATTHAPTVKLPPVVKALFASIRTKDGQAPALWQAMTPEQHAWIMANAPDDITQDLKDLGGSNA